MPTSPLPSSASCSLFTSRPGPPCPPHFLQPPQLEDPHLPTTTQTTIAVKSLIGLNNMNCSGVTFFDAAAAAAAASAAGKQLPFAAMLGPNIYGTADIADPPPPAPPKAPPPSRGLSTSAVVAIAVAVPAGGVAVIVVLVVLLLHRRSRVSGRGLQQVKGTSSELSSGEGKEGEGEEAGKEQEGPAQTGGGKGVSWAGRRGGACRGMARGEWRRCALWEVGGRERLLGGFTVCWALKLGLMCCGENVMWRSLRLYRSGNAHPAALVQPPRTCVLFLGQHGVARGNALNTHVTCLPCSVRHVRCRGHVAAVATSTASATRPPAATPLWRRGTWRAAARRRARAMGRRSWGPGRCSWSCTSWCWTLPGAWGRTM